MGPTSTTSELNLPGTMNSKKRYVIPLATVNIRQLLSCKINFATGYDQVWLQLQRVCHSSRELQNWRAWGRREAELNIFIHFHFRTYSPPSYILCCCCSSFLPWCNVVCKTGMQKKKHYNYVGYFLSSVRSQLAGPMQHHRFTWLAIYTWLTRFHSISTELLLAFALSLFSSQDQAPTPQPVSSHSGTNHR